MEAPTQDDMKTPTTKINDIDVTKPSPANNMEKKKHYFGNLNQIHSQVLRISRKKMLYCGKEQHA
jgi:hypothetical protein